MDGPIPIEAFYELKRISEVAVCPEGRRVAFVADEFNQRDETRERSLFVISADETGEPHRLSRASSAGSVKWCPSGTKLGFIASRETDVSLEVGRTDESDGDRDEKNAPFAPQVWAFDLERGGDARQVTRRDEGVREFDWGPAGNRIVVSASERGDEEQSHENGPVETERLQHKVDGRGWLDTTTSYLYVVDVDTRERYKLADAYGGGAHEPLMGLRPTWSSAGDRIAFLSNRTETPDDSYVMDVYTISPDGSRLDKLTDSNMWIRALEWSPDGTRVAFTKEHPDNWYRPSDVGIVTRDGETTVVSDELDRTVVPWATPKWVDDETLLVPFGDDGLTRLVRLAPNTRPRRVLDGLNEYRTVQKYDLNGGTVCVGLAQPDDAVNLFTFDVDSLDTNYAPESRLTRVTSVNRVLMEELSIPRCRWISFQSEGRRIEGLLYLPADFDFESPAPHPLVTDLHGGPMIYDSPSFSFRYAYWTSRDFVVFTPNYPGSSSYGRSFCESLRGDWGSIDVTDVANCVTGLVDRGVADPERLFCTGFSYGALVTAFLAARTDLFAAAAAEHGMYDIRSWFGTNDIHKVLENIFGLPWENPRAYDDASAITEVDRIDTPLLVTASERDWRCPPSQAEQLYVSVKKRGVPAKLVVYRDEHHSGRDPTRLVHEIQTLTSWFRRHDDS
jgi:dipeptidyl aminopeptidase/acylaminoacyl peptidase